MANPTISDYFGSQAEVLTTEATLTPDSTDPILVIKLSDFDDVGLNTVENLDDPDKILAAIIKKAKVFTDADTAEDSGVEIANPTKSFTTRKNASVVAIAYDVAFFIPDPTSNGVDPDQVI